MCSCYYLRGLGPLDVERYEDWRRGNPFSNSLEVYMKDINSGGNLVENVGRYFGNKVPTLLPRGTDPLFTGISAMPGRSEGIDPPSAQQGFCSLTLGDANRREQAVGSNYDRDTFLRVSIVSQELA